MNSPTYRNTLASLYGLQLSLCNLSSRYAAAVLSQAAPGRLNLPGAAASEHYHHRIDIFYGRFRVHIDALLSRVGREKQCPIKRKGFQMTPTCSRSSCRSSKLANSKKSPI